MDPLTSSLGAVSGREGYEKLCVFVVLANDAIGGIFADARCVWGMFAVGAKSPDLDRTDGNGGGIVGTAAAATAALGLSGGEGADGAVTITRSAGAFNGKACTGAD